MATQSPQSLPSFAQTFGSGPSSFSRLPDINNSLPPIQHRASPFDRSRRSPTHSSTPQPPPSSSAAMDPKQNSRKRMHAESAAAEADESTPSDTGRRSPRTVRIKEEADHDSIPPMSQPRLLTGSSSRRESVSSTPPSGSPNPAKKRRVTVSGLAPPIDTDVRRPSMDSGISPVVMGFTIQRDDPTALEQVRSMLSVKQKQKALIEQRRGSTAGIVAPVAPPSVNVVNPRPGSEEAQGPATRASVRTGGGRSPNTHSSSNNRRRSIVSVPSTVPTPNLAAASSSRPLSPNPPPAPLSTQQRPPPPTQRPSVSATAAQDTQHSSPPPVPVAVPTPSHLHPSSSAGSVSGPGVPPPPSSSNSLAPPSSGFARRRAGRQPGGKGKPADIQINALASSSSYVAPSIHSAPPIPRAGQHPGRFPSMAIPTLPQSLKMSGHPPMRLTSGQVPPTPTRLTLARHSVAHPGAGGVSGRSPSTASVPIAQTLVPPTPASLHHPGYSGEKSAFLAPFEMFYDALSDSKELKKWLGEQMQRSQTLITSLQRQHDHLEETISSIVDKKVSAMREEVYELRVRVDELESALRSKSVPSYSPNSAASKLKSKINGHTPPTAHSSISISNSGPPVFDTYTFPPVDPLSRRQDPVHRMSSPEVDPRSAPESQGSSPGPFDISKRASVSAMRLDPPLRSGDPHPPNTRLSFRDREGEKRDREPSHSYPPLSGRMSPRLPKLAARSALNHSVPSQQSMSSPRGTPLTSAHGQRYSVAVDKHQYKDGTSSVDPAGDGRMERDKIGERAQGRDADRGEGENCHPASAQRRNSIAAPTAAGTASSRSERSRPRSPMDTT